MQNKIANNVEYVNYSRIGAFMLSNNPNKTQSIERAWIRDIEARFSELRKRMLLIPISGLHINVSGPQSVEIKEFTEKLKETAISVMLSANWQNEYQTRAYKQGINEADKDLLSALTAQEAIAVGTLKLGADALINTSIHSAELEFLHDRANTKLAKWIDDMLFDTRSILHENLGVVSVDEIHEAITDRINATSNRARTIAVTEISQASQRSVIKEVEAINMQSTVEVDVVWISVKDSFVRHLHAGWHGQVMSNAQAARNITISPWNCRCKVKAVVKNRMPARLIALYTKERKILLKAIKK